MEALLTDKWLVSIFDALLLLAKLDSFESNGYTISVKCRILNGICFMRLQLNLKDQLSRYVENIIRLSFSGKLALNLIIGYYGTQCSSQGHLAIKVLMVQCGAVITRSIVSKFSQWTSHSSPVKAPYGISLVYTNLDLFSALVATVLYVKACCTGPRYMGTGL